MNTLKKISKIIQGLLNADQDVISETTNSEDKLYTYEKYSITIRPKKKSIEHPSPTPPVVQKPSTPPKPKPTKHTVLILLIKADSAAKLLNDMKQRGNLVADEHSELQLNTMKLWTGTDSQYNISQLSNEFARSECVDSFVKEYDYIAVKFKLDNIYEGCEKDTDSYTRGEFFRAICEDEIKCVQFSKRLCFPDKYDLEAY